MKLRLILIALIAAFSCLAMTLSWSAEAQGGSDKKKWDVTAPLGPVSEVEFVTDEGTWMNVDVSPDGKLIAFDLLGDIYLLPIDGGKATLLSGGPAFEVQPRFSPDGALISFTSDRGGADNIWIMNIDGSDPRRVTKEDFRLVNNACWTPDGEYIVARKHFTSRRSLGAGEMWLYHISGGKGLQLTKRKNDQQDAGEPCVSPDGRYVYFSEDMSRGPRFQYNKDPNGQIYVIRRYDLETGKTRNVVTGPGGAVRPQVSPDGTRMAFVRRVRTKSVLFVHDLQTGEQWPIHDEMEKDQQETWAIFGVYPNFDWTPDNKSLVFWAGGKIWKIDVKSRRVDQIPFEARVEQTINEALLFDQEVSPTTFEAKMVRHGVTSPDGRFLVFSAAGHLYKKRLPDGRPERLTNDQHFEYWPSFSPDGKWIVYTTWSDAELGAIYKVKSNGRGAKKLSESPGRYLNPSFSSDGSKITYRKVGGDRILGFTHGVDPGLYWLSAAGGEPHLIRESGRSPRFSSDGERVYFVQNIKDNKKAYMSVRLDGGDERTHVTSKYANQFVPSPDERWLAFTELYLGYIVAFPKTGKSVDLSGKTSAIPVNKVTRDAGIYLHWSGDGEKLHWTIGGEYFTRDLRDSFEFIAGAGDSLPPVDTTGVRIGLALETDVPTGKLALVGGRVVTMKGDEVIEDGTILVDGNLITAVGSTNEVDVPSGYTTVDVGGKTIVPGLVDVHAHMWHSGTGISPGQSWPYYANLAFGVTTTHDPSNPTEMVFTHSEMVKAGIMVGPRVYSTGTILYGAEGDFKAVVNSLDDARSHLRRMKAVGAFSVKSYNQPRRNQRQQVITAARELEMMVYPEGGSMFYHNLSMILDGHTTIEHTIPVAPIYDDVLKFWAASKTGLTPTLVVGYGSLSGEYYWYDKTNVWETERLMNFVPRRVVDARSRRRQKTPDDDYGHFALAKNCKQLIDVGVSVQLGAHGQLQGLGAHWEMWMFEQGGMTNMEAIRAATLFGARYLGMGDDLGSIEPGKLADLVVMDKNPLENIRNSEFVRYTMINGRLYDAMTMNEVGNHPRERDLFYWERPGASDAHVWRGDALGFGIDQCGCARH